MGLFCDHSVFNWGYLAKKILPKVQAPKRHKKERMAGCIEAELSSEGF